MQLCSELMYIKFFNSVLQQTAPKRNTRGVHNTHTHTVTANQKKGIKGCNFQKYSSFFLHSLRSKIFVIFVRKSVKNFISIPMWRKNATHPVRKPEGINHALSVCVCVRVCFFTYFFYVSLPSLRFFVSPEIREAN